MMKAYLLAAVLSFGTSLGYGQVSVPPSTPVVAGVQGQEEPYQQVEVVAEFPGGGSALGSFLSKNLNYPEEAIRNGIEGKVIAQFVIGKDGNLSKITILHNLGYGTAEEVVRVLKKMPKWKPAVVGGKSVASYYKLPVMFKLNDGGEE